MASVFAFWRWPRRRWFRIMWCLCAVGLLVALPLIIIEFKKSNFSVKYQAWFISGMFVLMAIPVTVYEVAMHLEYFSRPKLQIRVIRILWMVPVYAVDSWFALRFKDTHLYMDAARDCYEAFVIYNFFMYLLAYLEDEYGDIDAYFSTKEDIPHMWPVHYFQKPWAMGIDFFWQCKKGILNYVILRPLMSAVSLIANAFDSREAGNRGLDFRHPYPSIFGGDWNTWSKDQQEHDHKRTDYNKDEVAAGFQNFLICIEMFFAALAHAYAFPPKDYMDPGWTLKSGFVYSLRVMFDVRDVVDDVEDVVNDTVHRTAHNIHEAGRQTWSTARQSVTRPSSLLSIFSRSKPDEEWGSSDNAQDNADHRRQLLRYSNDHESNEAQETSTDDK
ncbi:hypothetical protein WJX79_002605 [Trebouxia sp. C0005]